MEMKYSDLHFVKVQVDFSNFLNLVFLKVSLKFNLVNIRLYLTLFFIYNNCYI